MSAPSRLSAPSSVGLETGPTAPGAGGAVPAPGLVGQRLGRYELRELVGSGGMGLVYAAWDPQLQRKVALKVLRPGLGEQQRLLLEAQALARLSHPHIITVHDAGVVGEQLFIALELVEGETLAAWLATERRSWQQVVEVYAQAGQGLAAAHAVGVVHCDFKPENVLLGTGGRVLVVDFGIALLGEEPTGAAPALGTPAYMAPEQHAPRGQVDARADQYSFCVALYEGLYGQRPFERTGDMERLAALKRAQALLPPPPGTKVPAHVHQALMRGLRAAPGERWPSLEPLLAELRRDTRRPLRRRLLAGGLVATYLAGFAAAWALREHTATANLCQEGAGRLAGVWDEASRARTREAVLTRGGPSAQATWGRVEEALNHYSTRWVASYESACAATHVHKVQSPQLLDHRMACLEARLQGMAALVSLLQQGDRALMVEAPRALHELPDLQTCTDAQALLRAQPLPTEPEQRRQVHALRRRLAEVQVLFSAGRYSAVLQAAEPLAQPVSALGYLPLQAELELLRGFANLRLLRDELALEHLRQAAWAAEASRHDDVAAQALSLLYTLDPSRPDLRERVEAAILRSGLAKPQARLDMADGGQAFRRGDYARALVHFQRVLEIQRQRMGPEHPDNVAALNNVASAHMQLGDYAQGLRLIAQAQALGERVLGADHPDSVIARLNEASMRVLLEQYDQALAQAETSLEPTRETLGPEHERIHSILLIQAQALTGLGRHPEALARLQEVLRPPEQQLGHKEHLEALRLWAQLLTAEGRPEEARRLLEHTLQRHPSAQGDPAMEARLLTGLAQALLAQGRLAQALRLLERAQQLQRTALPPYHPDRATTLHTLAWLLTRQRRCPQARQAWQQALEIRHHSLGSSHSLTGSLLAPLAPCITPGPALP